MADISTKTWAFVKAETDLYEYLEANGADGSDQYAALVAARNTATSDYEAALATFINSTAAP